MLSKIVTSRLLTPTLIQSQARFLNLQEYASKDVMRKFNVRVQRGREASTPEEARKVAEELRAINPKADLILKSQILAGGRGKGHFDTGFKGGVKLCETPAKVEELAKKMIGNNLITKQTGPKGQPVSKVLVLEGVSFAKELYFAIVLDRAMGGPAAVISPFGGMDIEEVAESHPDKIFTEAIDIKKGLTEEQATRFAEKLGFEKKDKATFEDVKTQMKNLYKLMEKTDATQVEINPLILHDKQFVVYSVDGKLNFDDNAEFRHKDIFALRDFTMEDPREVAASKFGLNYVGMDGNIGCMVNGAGLAMATMDIIKLHGGEPANFLDVGGGANQKQVEEAFKIITSDSAVEGVLVNIFGGIMKCDIIANAVVAAMKTVELKIPLVVRLEGTNVDKGKEIIRKSGLKIVAANDLDDAAKKVVKAVADSKKK